MLGFDTTIVVKKASNAEIKPFFTPSNLGVPQPSIPEPKKSDPALPKSILKKPTMVEKKSVAKVADNLSYSSESISGDEIPPSKFAAAKRSSN